MNSSLNFFLELEERFNECASSEQVFSLNRNERRQIKSSKLDFEVFKYDFDLNCRFISLFSELERKKYSKTHVTLLKYILIFSSFLKNRTSLKLTKENEILLTKATSNLASTLNISSSEISPNISISYYDAGKILIAYSLVNIHEFCGLSKTCSVNFAAQTFISNEIDHQIYEQNLVKVASKFDDYYQLSKCLDEIIESKPFSKYTKQPRIFYKDAIELRLLTIFAILVSVGLVLSIIVTEYFLSHFQ